MARDNGWPRMKQARGNDDSHGGRTGVVECVWRNSARQRNAVNQPMTSLGCGTFVSPDGSSINHGDGDGLSGK